MPARTAEGCADPAAIIYRAARCARHRRAARSDAPARDWYVGGNPASLANPGTFAFAIGGALSATIASAATSPSTASSSSGNSDSSSGSSGGGSSGDGGGGGGGSGW